MATSQGMVEYDEFLRKKTDSLALMDRIHYRLELLKSDIFHYPYGLDEDVFSLDGAAATERNIIKAIRDIDPRVVVTLHGETEDNLPGRISVAVLDISMDMEL